MKWTCLGLVGSLLALASCDTDVVRFDPRSAPNRDAAGLHVVLERFTKDTTTADIWLEVTNTTSSPITLKAPQGSTFWAKAFAGDQQAVVDAQRWSQNADNDDIDAKNEKDLHDPYVVLDGAKREIEVRCRLARPLATSHEPWKLVLYLADRGTIEIPISDPQVASTQSPARQ
jgi:hypothetical protein